MFVITDKNDIVADITTEKANLSRGYTFDGYKEHDNVEAAEIMIGDQFKDGVLIKNVQTRIDLLERAADSEKIQAEIKRAAIERLKAAGQLPPDYEDK